jgi:hypothetical protein
LRNAVLAIGVLLIAIPAAAQRWELLGTRDVTDRGDRDEIIVTGVRGDFTAVKLAVQRSPVQISRVVVHFANGGQQELEMRDIIRAGGETRAIDLKGNDRVIRRVEFWYEAKSVGRRGAVVRLFARN